MPVCPMRNENSPICDKPAAMVSELASPARNATGSTTKITTVIRSSTMSHPVAMRPPSVSARPASARFLMSTAVEAMDTDRPSMMPASIGQSRARPSPQPVSVPRAVCSKAPGTATRRTATRSSKEKCRPVPNIMNMTPTSASWLIACESPMKPGVNGPTARPPSR